MTTATLPTPRLVPGLLALLGFLVLLMAAVLTSSPYVGMGWVIVGGALTLAGYVLVQPAPLLLILPNLAVAVLLILQGLGLCQAACGGFVAYSYLGRTSTALVGLVVHLLAFGAGIAFLRRRVITANALRAITGLLQGVSLFFAMVMLVSGHWCPSCAACHLLMLAQGILVWRLTPNPQHLQVWILCIVIGALGANAAFHHRAPSVTLGAGQELLGYLAQAQERGEHLVVPTAAADVPPVSGAAAAVSPVPGTIRSTLRPADDRTLAQRDQQNLVGGGRPLRLQNFTLWGSAEAPVTVRCSMDLVCPGCRGQWPDTDKIRDLINGRKVAVDLVLSWPIQPETHHGARLATYAVYAAGMLGEEELLAAADRFFSTDGHEFMENVHTKLLAASSKGTIPERDLADALAATFQFLDGAVSPARALEAFRAHKSQIDAKIQGNLAWLLKNGDLRTPHYFFCRTGQSGPAFLDATTLDPEVWSTFATRGVTH